MNKQILFRGKSIQTCEWIYGGYYFWNGETFIIPYDRFAGDEYFSEALEDYCVETETVGQFLGINDKNKIKIFENDIDISGDVINSNSLAMYVLIAISNEPNDIVSNYISNLNETIEIIGNIFDNPEKVIS